MGDPEFCVGADQRLIKHLFLLIVHIRDKQGKEDHKLLNFPREHRIQLIVVKLVNQLHLRGNGVADLHDVDAVRRAGGNFNELAADLAAGTAKLMPFDWRDDEALYAAHTHSQGQKLHCEGFSGA